MKKFRFKKLDAFAKGSSSGNPAGCVYLERIGEIQDEEMQAIARQLEGFVNEVVYIFPEGDGFFLKYYSAEREVDFCGHGTIAAMYDLINTDLRLMDKKTITIRVKDESLDVINDMAGSGSVYITAPLPLFSNISVDAETISTALRISDAVDAERPIAMINAGLNTLIVPITTLGQCLAIHPDEAELKVFCRDSGIDIILVYSSETSDPERQYRTRVFAPLFGYLEDPATGSGNSAFACYLLHNGMWDGAGTLAVEQNNDRTNPNIIRLRSIEKDRVRRVLFGGGAVVRIEGEYCLS